MPFKSLRSYLPLILSFLGVIIFGAGFYYYFFMTSDVIKSTKTETSERQEVRPLHSKPNPVKIVIGGVKIDLPVTEGKIVDGVWETTQEGVSHLTISANPGENGNIVIYGHNKKRLFGSLPYVSMGAVIKVIAEDGVEYNYKVYEKKDVAATDVSIVYATPDEVLTLYTCDGPLDGKRFVLFAKPI